MEKRNINIDIIKVCAVFFVVAVHFFYNNNFYNTLINGNRMYIMGIMRTFFMICVPLFLLITGYLMNKKELSLNFYKGGIKRIILPYIIISFITLIFKLWFFKCGILPPPRHIIDYCFRGLIDFNLIEYAWYVDLYLGLFLLIPFINKVFTNKKQDLILILILVFLTALPSVCKRPIFILSEWTCLYPVSYYVIGAYISRNEIKFSVKNLLITFIIVFSIFSAINILIVKGHLWDLHSFDSYGGLENMINSVLFFLLILKINFNNLSEKIKFIITDIAKLSLGIYLSSYIFDKIVYYYFNQFVESTPAKLEYFVLIVPFIFICSICMAKFADFIQHKIEMCVNKNN